MLLAKYPDITVLYLKDTYDDVIWSNCLDRMIKDIIGPNDKPYLYGSRDSFIKYYSGKYECIELEQNVFVSGTDVRKAISKQVKASSDFRTGVIWAVGNQYPKCISTVDICLYKKDNQGNVKILLGKRDTEPKYRFIGGFVPPGETYEQTAIRETKEETDLDIEDPKYLKSFVIDDWRYRKEADKITTSLFLAKASSNPKPGDDIDELRWVVLDEVVVYNIVDEHKELIQCVLDYFNV
jgi:bifunctional NMN adenylyltransferase/nudix hydrolase